MPPLLKDSWAEIAADPSVTMYVTEGEKKAACACINGIPCAALGGVWNWTSKKKIDTPLIPDLMGFNFKDRDVVLVFDSDVNANSLVRDALNALARELVKLGARVFKVILPLEADKKTGLDDYLLEAGIDAFNQLDAEREQFDFSEKLWALNKEYALLREPGSIGVLHLPSGVRHSDKDFRLRESNNLILEKDPLTGRMREILTADRWLKWDMHNSVSRRVYEPRPFGEPRQIGDGTFNLSAGLGHPGSRRWRYLPV